MLNEEQVTDPIVRTTLLDLTSAVLSVSDMTGIVNLTDVMKQSLINGVLQVKYAVATLMFNYYSENDFELDETQIPLLRDVVQCYAEAGGRL